MSRESATTRQRAYRVLIVDDDRRFCRLLEYNLGKWGYASDAAGSARDLREAIGRHPYDVILLDIRLPDGSGTDLVAEICEVLPCAKIIMISAHGTIEMAMDCVRSGAYDFLSKPLDLDRCRIILRNAFEFARREQEYELLRAVISERDRLGMLIGASPAMQAVYEVIGNVAASDCSVLITGETGTGKELVAAELHRLSNRAPREMITVNCAAIPSELIESEMFGHMKGSFTGAAQDKAGAAERADGSTLFLDEITELNLELQAKLLRFLQDKQVTRVGGSKARQVNVRIIAASNREPDVAVSSGKLRMDLLYRINVIRIHLPPLRERRTDIPILAAAFLSEAAAAHNKNFTSFDGKARRVLMEADWPGNVRQLKNVITETVLMNNGATVTVEMLPATVRESADQGGRYRAEPSHSVTHLRIRPLWEVEKYSMQQALFACHGNVTEAAQLLEMSRPTLYRKIKRFKLETGIGAGQPT